MGEGAAILSRQLLITMRNALLSCFKMQHPKLHKCVKSRANPTLTRKPHASINFRKNSTIGRYHRSAGGSGRTIMPPRISRVAENLTGSTRPI